MKIWDLSETTRAITLKFYTHVNRAKYSFQVCKFFRYGAQHPRVNLGPPHISETTRAIKLKFYTHLDRAY